MEPKSPVKSSEERRREAHGIVLDLGIAEDDLVAAEIKLADATRRVEECRRRLSVMRNRIEACLVAGEVLP